MPFSDENKALIRN